MLRKRIIFTLIHSHGFFMQSRNFRLQKVGNISWLEKNYKFQKIAFSLDELIVLDATRDRKSIKDFASVVNRLVDNVFIPIAAGGGIRNMDDAEILFKNGADKIVLNSILLEDASLVKELVQRYGTQSIIASVDYLKIDDEQKVLIHDGTVELDMTLSQYIKYIQTLRIGEVYLNSIEKDGTGFGYDFEGIKAVTDKIKVPLIIAGGAGNEAHLIQGLQENAVSAVATANLFNFVGNGLPNARKKILDAGFNIANWGNSNF